jgi:hypothetical protein
MLLPLARAKPLPLVPRPLVLPPRTLPYAPIAPWPLGARFRAAGAGVENFDIDLEDVGGCSTKDVSVVLEQRVSLASRTLSSCIRNIQERSLPIKILTIPLRSWSAPGRFLVLLGSLE